VKQEHSISYHRVPDRGARKRKKKPGRPAKHWSLRTKYQRRHCPDRLRRCEVENLIEADRFAARTLRRLASFITIRWSFTRDGEKQIQKRWSALLNALRIWTSRRGIEIAHIWVHENPPRDVPSFNSHMLANIPPGLRNDLKAWLMKTLGDVGGAIDVQPRTCFHWKKPDDRISYLCKGTDKATAMKYRLIKHNGWDYNQGRIDFRRSGTSRNINVNSRAMSLGLQPRGIVPYITVDNGEAA
jgi:hypothetical protein